MKFQFLHRFDRKEPVQTTVQITREHCEFSNKIRRHWLGLKFPVPTTGEIRELSNKIRLLYRFGLKLPTPTPGKPREVSNGTGIHIYFPTVGEGGFYRKIISFTGKIIKRSLFALLFFSESFGAGRLGAEQSVVFASGSAPAPSNGAGKEYSALQISTAHSHRCKSAPLKEEIPPAVPFFGKRGEQNTAPVRDIVRDILHAPNLKRLQLLIKRREEREFQRALCEKQLCLKTPPDSCYGFPDLTGRADFHCLNLKIQNVSLSSLNKALKGGRLSAICRRRLEFFKKILLYRQKDAFLKKTQAP